MGDKKGEKRLKRDLGLLDIFCIASGAMISSGLFVLPGIAYSYAGPAIILSYAIASLLVLPAVFSKAELATAMPKAGGTYFFIDRSMGPLMGTIGGFAAWFSLAFKSAFALVGIGVFAVLLNPGFTELQMKLIAVLFCLLFAVINIVGTKHTGKTQVLLVGALLVLLAVYVVSGLFFIESSNFTNFTDKGFGIFTTAGLIFVSFGGLTKVASVAEECKKPARTIPLGMFLSWGLISVLYLLVITVTVGLVPGNVLGDSLTPISEGANMIPLFAGVGGVVLAIAAILAFISTANAGLLAASRDPMAMGKDQLLPSAFAKVSKRGTPVFSIVFTTIFMIVVILFLDIKDLVKTASALKILLFLLISISLIIMRESKIRNYRPKFKSPLYPWMQIAGIIGFVSLIVMLVLENPFPVALAGCFVGFGFVWYGLYARDKIWREYTFLNVIERVTGQKSSSYLVDEELREIIIERDNLQEKRFEKAVKNAEVVDLYKYMKPDKFNQLIAEKLSKKLNIKVDKLSRLLLKRERDSNVVIHPGVAIVSHTIKGRDKFEILLVRSRMGIVLKDNMDPIHAFFIIVASPDEKNYYMHALMWIIRVAEEEDFDKKWVNAKDAEGLKQILLDIWEKKREI